MKTSVKNARVNGILTLLPKAQKSDEGIMRFRVKEDTYTTDLFINGVKYLVEKDQLDLSDVGAILTASYTPDYLIPQLSFRVHGALDFDEEVLCMDVLDENVGYIKGLMDAMLLAEKLVDKKVLFLCGNISDKKKVSEVNYYGHDGASIMVVEHSEDSKPYYFEIHTDGSKNNLIKIHSGGFRDLFHEEGNEYTYEEEQVAEYMEIKGANLINNLFTFSGLEPAGIDRVSLPYVSASMKQMVASKCGISMDCILEDEDLKNSVIVNSYHITSQMKPDDENIWCLLAYGAGISYGSAILPLEALAFCETVHMDL